VRGLNSIIIIIIPGKHEVEELQKTAILGTAHTSESTNVKVQ